MFNSKEQLVYNIGIEPNVTKSQIQHQAFLAPQTSG